MYGVAAVADRDRVDGRASTPLAAVATKPATLTRADLAEHIHREVGLSRADAANQVEAVLRHLCEALSSGNNVKISGFGSFVLRDKGERIGRNPKTGVEVPIAPRRVLTFRPSQTMRARILEQD